MKHRTRVLTISFGKIIRQLREKKGLSQEEFASFCGLHRTYIGAIERGEKTVTLETAKKLASSFDISLCLLIDQAERNMKEK